MACKNILPVLLGFEDEYISEKHKYFVDFTTNKIGGKPDWHQPTCTPNTKCRLCGANLPLLIQIYAPLEGSKYHRTLFLFACIQPMCWNRNESWLCIRQQSLCSTKEEQHCEPASSSVTFWNAEADNWDIEDDIIPSDDQENGNVVVNCQVRNLRTPEDTDTDESSISVEEVSDPNANSAGADEGAFAVEFNNKLQIASAEIEIGDDSAEIVSIDTPTRPQPVAELFLQVNQKCRSIKYPEFVPVFISVFEEVLCGNRSKLNDHEMSLLQQYQQSELGGGDLCLEGRVQVAEAGGGGDITAEQYEKEVPIHGDLLGHRFISRLQQTPGQILRYGRGAEPILLQPLSKSNKHQRCQHCGGEMIFELQLLPSLLSSLNLTESMGDSSNIIEFGTVLVNTCKDSCWIPDEGGYREEYINVQAESM